MKFTANIVLKFYCCIAANEVIKMKEALSQQL